MLISCRIGTKPDGFYPFREKGEGVGENAQSFEPCRDIAVAVSELCVKDTSLLCPVGIQRLIGFVSPL